MQTIEKTVTVPRFTVSVSCFWDSDLAQFWFDDFTSGEDCPVLYLDSSYLVVGDSLHDSYFKKSHISRLKKSKLLETAEYVFCYNSYYDYSEYTKAELIAELLQVTNEQYYTAHYYNESWGNLERDFTAYGHCQGDAIAVNLLNAPKWITKEYIENIFYNQPFHCVIELYDELGEHSLEINLQELSDDYYSYDNQQLELAVKNYLEKHHPQISGELVDMLADSIPNYPKY